MIELWIFLLITIFLLLFTLARSGRHRFPRFFAFESIIALVLLNAHRWFYDPLSTRQMVSWVFLVISLFLAIHGFRLLRIVGLPVNDIENTTQLVTRGAYRYIRHPLYCSLLSGGIGAFLKVPSALGFLLFTFVCIFSYMTAKVEEKDNIERFGEEYLAYMKTTKMFVPYLI